MEYEPKEGDEVSVRNREQVILIDKVDSEEVGFRVTDGKGGLLKMARMPLEDFVNQVRLHDTAVMRLDDNGMIRMIEYGSD
jgi:hypothetical protein